MITANNKVSILVEDQIPGFIREDHNNFVQFVKSYYEFLELQNPPTDVPLVVLNPSETIYTDANPYGAGPLIVGETIEQRSNFNDLSEITASATVFAYTANTTSKTVTVTNIEGSTGKFVRNQEIVGKESGVVYWPSRDIEKSRPGALQAAYDVGTIRDIDLTTSQYLEFIQREIASGFPTNFTDAVDKRVALKNLRDFYRSKGTENSFKLLFRLIYGEDIELYLPSEDMLRPSVGEWEQRTVLRLEVPVTDAITNENRSVSDIVGKSVRGLSSGATAIIERAQIIIYAGSAFVEAEISSKVGTFEANETIRISYVSATTNSPVTINLKNYGIISSVDVINGGSNYEVGDRVSIAGGGGIGAIAQVAAVNDDGSVQSIDIIDPGYLYSSIPTTLNLDEPHSGESGSIRFNTGSLETLLDYNFDQLQTANQFYAESDNRGPQANTGGVGFDIYESNGTTIIDPSTVGGFNVGNFVTVPGEDEGLQAWWSFDAYNLETSTYVNTLDGTFGDGNDPTANTDIAGYWGPRVADSEYRPNIRLAGSATFGYGNYDPLKAPRYEEDTEYNPNGWVGFKPLVRDKTGNGRHAWLQTTNVLSFDSGFTGRANVFTSAAFQTTGIFGSTSNSWVNGPDGGQESLGGIVLRAHDDLRNANTQTWVFWYYPYGEFGSFGGTYNNDTEWVTFESNEAQYDANNAPNIISRDGSAFWSLQANVTSVASPPYYDTIFRFQGATWDNGNAANGQVANTSGLFPGHTSGSLNAGGGTLRAQTWNMIALTIDYTNQVGNLYFFNTTDGFHSSNGFSIDASQDANTGASGWPTLNGDTQGRAVVLGAASASANGDSNSVEQNPASSAHGRFDEARYYDTALSAQQIVHLFKNPGGRFDNTLSGNWAIVNPANSTFAVLNPVTTVLYDETEETNTLNIGSITAGADGIQLVYNQNIEFDPYSHYRITVRAKDTTATNASNVQFGVIGVANTGTSLIGYNGGNDWDETHAIVQSPYGNDPPESGSLGEDWFDYTAVFGGNTSSPGWSESFPTTDTYSGTGGNTAQENSETSTFTWANPAKLFGSDAPAVQQGTGNTTYFRPVLRWDDWEVGDISRIQYIRVEASRPASLSATLAGEFTYPGQDIGDAGKLSTSPTGLWTPKYLSDNNFYQAYSYVIRSGLSINTYRSVVERLVHTTGKKLFGEVDYVSVVSAKSKTQAFFDAVVKLFVDWYAGAESSLIGEEAPFDGQSASGDVGFKSDFGLYNLPELSFDLDLAHGEFDSAYEFDEAIDGDDWTYYSPDGPAWIAWDQSPLDNPYANGHFNPTLYPDPTYLTSNASTNATKTTLLWNCNGALAKLVTGYEDIANGIYALDGHANTTLDQNQGVNWQNRQGLPLRMSSDYRYVRMKVRRVGPGGYGDNDWLGACQAETIDVQGGSFFQPEPGGTNIGANTISQPATLIVPAGSNENTKSPWHILEWDMHSVGTGDLPDSGNNIPSDIFSTNDIGWLGITLVSNPTENETFEIDWIQMDDGTDWPRGSFVYPIGRTNQVADIIGPRDQFSSGAGVDGYQNTVSVVSSVDYSNRNSSEFSLTVDAPNTSEIKFANTAANNATVVYISNGRESVAFNSTTILSIPNGASQQIWRVSANTANATDWIVSTQIAANTDVDRYSILTDPGATTYNWCGPAMFEVDANDNLYTGYIYTEDQGSYPGTSNFATPANNVTSDSRPVFVFHYQPVGNVAATGVIGGNTGHNFYGVSNTYINEQPFYGNTATTGYEVLSRGPRALEENFGIGNVGDYSSVNLVDMFFDDQSAMHLVGHDSQNVVKITPAPGKSRDGTDFDVLPLILGEEPRVLDVPYYDGLSNVRVGPDKLPTSGVQTFQLVSDTTIDANGMVLGTWNPHHGVLGPKGSFFIACNNYSTDLGTNSIYCYHVIPSQNTSTGDWYAANVYPVYANTRHSDNLWQGCAGLAVDHHDPPNLYYATPNTVYKITPKGYSYEIGDTEIVQLINEDQSWWDTNHATGASFPPLGKYDSSRAVSGDVASEPWLLESNYLEMKVDRRNRLFMAGRANLYMYDTTTNEFSVIYNPVDFHPDIDAIYLDSDTNALRIADFDLDAETGEIVFIVGKDGGANRSIAASIRPNANGEYDISSGALAQMLLVSEPSANNRFSTPAPGGPNFETNPSAKIRIRKKKK